MSVTKSVYIYVGLIVRVFLNEYIDSPILYRSIDSCFITRCNISKKNLKLLNVANFFKNCTNSAFLKKSSNISFGLKSAKFYFAFTWLIFLQILIVNKNFHHQFSFLKVKIFVILYFENNLRIVKHKRCIFLHLIWYSNKYNHFVVKGKNY